MITATCFLAVLLVVGYRWSRTHVRMTSAEKRANDLAERLAETRDAYDGLSDELDRAIGNANSAMADLAWLQTEHFANHACLPTLDGIRAGEVELGNVVPIERVAR
jgi:hypothetical protein